MIMDMVRSFHTADMRVSVNPDTVVKVRWYRAPEGAKVLPTAHAFGLGPAWETGARDYPTADLGQVDVGRKWNKGLTPEGVTGQETHTPLEWFRSGVPPEAVADPPEPECSMNVDLTDDTVLVDETTDIIIDGPGPTVIDGDGTIVIDVPTVIKDPVTVEDVLIIDGPAGGGIVLPPTQPTGPQDGSFYIDTVNCTLRFYCDGWHTVGESGRMPTSEPAAPVDGDCYLDTSTCRLRIRCGGAWHDYAPFGEEMRFPPDAPASPVVGDSYFDDAGADLYIWGGSNWFLVHLIGAP